MAMFTQLLINLNVQRPFIWHLFNKFSEVPIKSDTQP